MKALVIRQPWAELILCGQKTIEVRSRRTGVTDEFLIVAGKTIDKVGMELHGPRPLHAIAVDRPMGMSTTDIERIINPPMVTPSWMSNPKDIDIAPGSIIGALKTGVAVGIARVYKIEAFHSSEHEQQAMIPWDGHARLWAWHLGNVRRIKPFHVRGMPGFFNVDTTDRL